MKIKQLFLFKIVVSSLAFFPAQAAQKDNALMPEAGSREISCSQKISLDEKIEIIISKRKKEREEKLEIAASVAKEKLITELELAILKKMQEVIWMDAMAELVQLQDNPDLALRVIELTGDKEVPILWHAINCETIWPLWQILQSSYLIDPNKVREKVNYRAIFDDTSSRSLLESALKKGNFHAAEILLHFGADPCVNPFLLNLLKSTKRFAYLALLWVYEANLPDLFLHPIFEELKRIIATDKKLAIKIAIELYRNKWEGDGMHLLDIVPANLKSQIKAILDS